jgi:hypothetical protein
MSTREIERRLSAVEEEIANLKAERRPAADGHPIHTLEKIHGTFENDLAFQEATRLGRKWRDSHPPSATKSKAKRK